MGRSSYPPVTSCGDEAATLDVPSTLKANSGPNAAAGLNAPPNVRSKVSSTARTAILAV
jgi:hypothetical protein